jgi:hypothetical protein
MKANTYKEHLKKVNSLDSTEQDIFMVDYHKLLIDDKEVLDREAYARYRNMKRTSKSFLSDIKNMLSTNHTIKFSIW